MPLTQSPSRSAFEKNVNAELSAGKPRDQALAISYAVQKRNRADGGRLPGLAEQSSRKLHVGPIVSPIAGRTDHINMTVPVHSYVIPADIVSALGEGNTEAGQQVLEQMFGPASASPTFADGGAAQGGVDIVAAGGENVLSPEQVAEIGGGDVKRGHSILDKFVKDERAKHIKTLRKLPGPKRK